jgi:hypothetical protein
MWETIAEHNASIQVPNSRRQNFLEFLTKIGFYTTKIMQNNM